MSELFAAIDEVNEGEYLGIVVGLKENIDNNVSKLPNNFSHMTRSFVSKKEKMSLLQKLELKGNIHVCCIKFGLPQLENSIEKIVKKKKLRKPKHIINNQIAHELAKTIHDMYDEFVSNYKCNLNEIKFQVDNKPIMGLLKSGNLKDTKPLGAHKIADCVAHANGKHWPIDGVIPLGDEFKRKFHMRVINRITR